MSHTPFEEETGDRFSAGGIMNMPAHIAMLIDQLEDLQPPIAFRPGETITDVKQCLFRMRQDLSTSPESARYQQAKKRLYDLYEHTITSKT